MHFEQTPLFQIDLMVWLSWPAFSEKVTPVFYQDNYRLYRIAPSIPTSLRYRPRLDTLPVRARRSPTPDLLLRNETTQPLLTLECKVSSFGPDREQAGQASALLSLTGSYLADYFGMPRTDDWSAYLLYALSEGQQDQMCDTLLELSDQLRQGAIETAPSGSMGIEVTDNGVYLRPEPRSSVPVSSLHDESERGVLVMELEPDEDPRPLYVIPLDPSVGVGDDYERRELEERVRVALTSLIGSRLDVPRLEIELDEVLREAIEVWDVWGDRNSRQNLKNAIKEYTRTILRRLVRMGLQVNVANNRITIEGIEPALANKVRKFLTSVPWRKGEVDLWSEAVQLDFSDLADGW